MYQTKMTDPGVLLVAGSSICCIFCKIFFVLLVLSLIFMILNMFKYKYSIGPVRKANGKYKLGFLKNGEPISWQDRKKN